MKLIQRLALGLMALSLALPPGMAAQFTGQNAGGTTIYLNADNDCTTTGSPCAPRHIITQGGHDWTIDTHGSGQVSILDSTGTLMGTSGNPFLVTLTGSNTITANAGTNLNTSALALDATLTGGTAQTQMKSGAKGTSAAALVTSTASGVNHQPFDVIIYDTSGNAITSFGGSGGTSSNFGSAFPTPGTAMGISDGTNMQGGHAFDLDSGAGTEYNQGIILRKAASGGSVAFGTSTDPVRTDPTGTTNQPVVLQANSGVDIGKLTANQSVNVAQVNGVTPLMGNGLTGTGSQRVTIASDNTAFSVNAVQSGTWTVQPGNTANTTAWKVDNSAVTQPASIADGSLTTLGAKADAAATATDTTAVSGIALLKEISKMEQAPASRAVTNAGTFAVQAASAGDVASGSSDSGNPVKQGYLAKTALPTAVTDAQRVNGMSDKFGRQVVIPGTIRDLVGVQQTTVTASTAETTIVTAGAAGVFDDITNLTITNSSATATLVTIKDSTAGTTRAIYSIPANGGIVIPFPVPLAQSGAAANWTETCGTSLSSLYFVVTYAQNK